MTLPGPEFTALIAPHTGEVFEVSAARRGADADVAGIVTCEKGAFFVKAVPNRPGGRRESLVREGLIDPHVVPISPPLRWRAEDDAWVVLGFEPVSARSAGFEPGSVDLPAVVELVARIGELAVPPVAAEWWETRWHRFAADEAEAVLFDGDALLYTDFHFDNVLIGERGETWAVDWAWPTRGAGFIDPACLVLQLIAAGHTAEAAEALVAGCPAWGGADPAGTDAFAAAQVRMLREFAARRPGETWRGAMVAAAERWADHRGVTVGLPGVA
ncbi:protein kinase [Allonocardiopsis opalescens]|uniref:Phosphotransferase family enzyme n=1 Tax=Allonocardiopsis opalescens TaxID=1144618 RepID=A0A2T0Q352_9ACTN|nr:protein kinase [Allonocardiopsis opalescens]PRX98098.1 hypothetical protein CLV72_105451 [Allonocardiopsis opalescens]